MRNSFAKVVFSKAESKLNPITLGIANPKRVARIKPKYPKLKSFLWLNTKESILNKYLICKHNKFKDPKIVNILKNSRGLIYFLSGCEFNQKKLEEFIKFCRLNEDANGFLTQSFFKIIKDENIFNYLFANFLLASGFGVVMNFLSLFLKNNDLTVGYFFISYSVVVSLVRIFFADRFSSKNLFKKVLLMLTLFAATLFFIPYIDSKSDIILFSVLFSLTYSLVYPFLSSIVVTGKSQALTGRLFGALNSSFSIGVNLMTFFYGFIAEIWGFNTMFQVASVLIFLGVGFVFMREGRVA